MGESHSKSSFALVINSVLITVGQKKRNRVSYSVGRWVVKKKKKRERKEWGERPMKRRHDVGNNEKGRSTSLLKLFILNRASIPLLPRSYQLIVAVRFMHV